MQLGKQLNLIKLIKNNFYKSKIFSITAQKVLVLVQSQQGIKCIFMILSFSLKWDMKPIWMKNVQLRQNYWYGSHILVRHMSHVPCAWDTVSQLRKWNEIFIFEYDKKTAFGIFMQSNPSCKDMRNQHSHLFKFRLGVWYTNASSTQ